MLLKQNFMLIVGKRVPLSSGSWVVGMSIDSNAVNRIKSVDYTLKLKKPTTKNSSMASEKFYVDFELGANEDTDCNGEVVIHLNDGADIHGEFILKDEPQRIDLPSILLEVAGVPSCGQPTIGSLEIQEPQRIPQNNINLIINRQLQHLESNIEKDLQLLNECEDALRSETDPVVKQKYKSYIKRYHLSARENLANYARVAGDNKGELHSKLEDMNNQLSDILRRIDDLNKNDKLILREMGNIKEQILSQLEANVARIINVIVDGLKQNERVLIASIYNGIDKIDISARVLDDTINMVRQALSEIQLQKAVLAKNVGEKEIVELSQAIDDPKMDVKHKILITVPIIPLILQYRGEVALTSSVNLEKAWQWLKDIFISDEKKENVADKDSIPIIDIPQTKSGSIGEISQSLNPPKSKLKRALQWVKNRFTIRELPPKPPDNRNRTPQPPSCSP
jgi:hypothetical protein